MAARDVGGYQAYGTEGWNDEVLIGDEEGARLGEREEIMRRLVEDSVVRQEVLVGMGSGSGSGGGGTEREVVKPEGRETEADRNGDEKSLERKLERTLYLVVKGPNGRWGFPKGQLVGRENLHAVSILLSFPPFLIPGFQCIKRVRENKQAKNANIHLRRQKES